MRAKKSLGQHFLHDSAVIRKIIGSIQAQPGDRVIEVGAGTGALTGLLSEKYADLHLYEVDSRAVKVLKHRFPGAKVHEKSILEADFISMLPIGGSRLAAADKEKARHRSTTATGAEGNPGLFIVGNLPYFLTSPILFMVMDQGMLFSQAVFMMQREVAQRLTASPGTPQYGILSVQAQALGRIERILNVGPGAFNPPPKVHSSVISYQPGNARFPNSLEDFPVPLSVFKKVVKTAFHQRRKKLSNALKELLQGRLPSQFHLHRRAGELHPEEYVELSAWLHSVPGEC